jgi:hypothetical protein
LFQPVVSYNNTITICAIADRDMMPDPAFYSECLQASFDELRVRTIGADAPKKASKTARKKTASRRNGNAEHRPTAT